MAKDESANGLSMWGLIFQVPWLILKFPDPTGWFWEMMLPIVDTRYRQQISRIDHTDRYRYYMVLPRIFPEHILLFLVLASFLTVMSTFWTLRSLSQFLGPKISHISRALPLLWGFVWFCLQNDLSHIHISRTNRQQWLYPHLDGYTADAHFCWMLLLVESHSFNGHFRNQFISGNIPTKYGLIWHSTSIVGSWNDWFFVGWIVDDFRTGTPPVPGFPSHGNDDQRVSFLSLVIYPIISPW